MSKLDNEQNKDADSISQVVKAETGSSIQNVVQSITSSFPLNAILYAVLSAFIIAELCIYLSAIFNRDLLFYQLACYPCCFPFIITFLYGLFSKRNVKIMILSAISGFLTIAPWIFFGIFLLLIALGIVLKVPFITKYLSTPTPTIFPGP